MADHSKPLTTSTYANFVTELDGRFDDITLGLDPAVTSPTNLPTGAIRWNSSSSKWEKWSGTAWADLATAYAINLSGPIALTANSTSDALRITQIGSGNALVVEDSANPDSTPFVIDTSGNVIINKDSASSISGTTPKLQQHGAGTAAQTIGIFSWVNDTYGSFIRAAKSNSGTIGTQAIVSSDNTILNIGAFGSDGINFIEAARITAAVDGTPGTNDMPGRLVFSTTADGASAPTERMRIDSAGRVCIGGTVNTGSSVTINRAITGAVNQYVLLNNGTVQSDVTTRARYYETTAATASAPFMLTDMTHYSASQGTFGAGSTVLNQYGFVANNTLTGATNNYGFYSNIAAGTGRWNFYADGTASNYFAGNALFGTTSYIDVWNTTQNIIVAGTSNPGISIVQANDAASPAVLSFAKSRGTSPGNWTTPVQSGDNIGAISFFGADGTTRLGAARITATVDGTPGTDDMPGRLTFMTTPDGASAPTEAMRITNSNAVLIGTSTTPTKSGSGSLTLQSPLVIGGFGSVATGGRCQIYVNATGSVTATTGTLVFTLKSTTINQGRNCFVKLSVTQRPSNNSISTNLPSAEYWFALYQNTSGVVSINSLTTMFEYTYVRATHFAFSNLGNGVCTITLVNPTAQILTNGTYKVEILDPNGNFYLDTVVNN